MARAAIPESTKLLLALCLSGCACVRSAESGWRMGAYAGRYFDTSPTHALAGFPDTVFEPHYLAALHAMVSVWRPERAALELEIEAVLAQRFGGQTITEAAMLPVLRWDGFPWKEVLYTAVRLGPLGASWVSSVYERERTPEGFGSPWLNFLVFELAWAAPERRGEWFLRLHHRSAIFDLLLPYKVNGDDFLAFGYRYGLPSGRRTR